MIKTSAQIKPTIRQKPVFSASFNQYLDIVQLSNYEVRRELLNLLKPNPWFRFNAKEFLDPLYAKAEEGVRRDLYYQLHTCRQSYHLEAACFIIESLDEHGFFHFHEEQPFPYPQEVVVQTLKLIQSFEPEGIALENSVAYVCYQLEKKKDAVALRILKECDALVLDQDFDAIRKKLGISQAELDQAFQRIRRCQIYPCTIEEPSFSERILPDVLLEIEEDQLIITPTMQQFNPFFIQPDQLSEAARAYLEKLNLLLDLINRRNLTLLQIFHALTEIQRDSLLYQLPLRPCRLEDVSWLCGVHPSTISRCCRNKYFEFQQEIKPFNALLASGNIAGISHDELRFRLLELIATESPDAPLQDEQLTALLNAQNIPISRRGLSNLRKKWKIPNSYQRKRAFQAKEKQSH